MPVVIDVRSTDDQRDLVHRAVQALAEGRLVAFPTDTEYCLAANALHCDAVARLAALRGNRLATTLTLVLKSAEEATDYVPHWPAMGARLARRCWPGPLTIAIDNPNHDSLLRQLPPSVRELASPQRQIRLRVPAHPLIQAVQRLAPAPLVVASIHCEQATVATTAHEVVQRLGDDVQMILDDGRSRFGQAATTIHLTGNSWEVVTPGVLSEENLRRLASFMLVFVCTGNTCRSPMAEALMRRRFAAQLKCDVAELEDRGIWISSAGVAAMAGSHATPEADQAVAAWGLRLTHHESQPLSDRIVRFADLLLTMTRGHRESVLSQWPDASSRVRLLGRGGGDVADPIGGPLEQYRQCAEQIDRHLESWMKEFDLDQIPAWTPTPRPRTPRH